MERGLRWAVGRGLTKGGLRESDLRSPVATGGDGKLLESSETKKGVAPDIDFEGVGSPAPDVLDDFKWYPGLGQSRGSAGTHRVARFDSGEEVIEASQEPGAGWLASGRSEKEEGAGTGNLIAPGQVVG